MNQSNYKRVLQSESIDSVIATYVANAKVRDRYLSQNCISDANRKSFLAIYDESMSSIEDVFCDKLDEIGVPLVHLMEKSSGFIFKNL